MHAFFHAGTAYPLRDYRLSGATKPTPVQAGIGGAGRYQLRVDFHDEPIISVRLPLCHSVRHPSS